jgi:hypothetical protein
MYEHRELYLPADHDAANPIITRPNSLTDLDRYSFQENDQCK